MGLITPSQLPIWLFHSANIPGVNLQDVLEVLKVDSRTARSITEKKLLSSTELVWERKKKVGRTNHSFTKKFLSLGLKGKCDRTVVHFTCIALQQQ